MIIGSVLIAATQGSFPTYCVEALDLINPAKEALAALMACNIEEEPWNGVGIWRGISGNDRSV